MKELDKIDFFEVIKNKDLDKIKYYLERYKTEINLNEIKDPNYEGNWSPLHFASFFGDFEMTNLFIINGANPNIVDKYNKSPLHYSSLLYGDFDGKVAVCLLNASANKDAQDNNGFTPLHQAVWNNNFKVVEILLKSEADPSIKDNQGRTPEKFITRYINPKIVGILDIYSKIKSENWISTNNNLQKVINQSDEQQRKLTRFQQKKMIKSKSSKGKQLF